MKAIILAALLAAAANTHADTCDQMRSYGMTAFKAHQSGATASELYDRANAQAGGDKDLSTLLINIIQRSLQGSDAGDAGRRAYSFCKSSGF